MKVIRRRRPALSSKEQQPKQLMLPLLFASLPRRGYPSASTATASRFRSYFRNLPLPHSLVLALAEAASFLAAASSLCGCSPAAWARRLGLCALTRAMGSD